jgi:hypothetical protein
LAIQTGLREWRGHHWPKGDKIEAVDFQMIKGYISLWQ